jgi:hypothetical protein
MGPSPDRILSQINSVSVYLRSILKLSTNLLPNNPFASRLLTKRYALLDCSMHATSPIHLIPTYLISIIHLAVSVKRLVFLLESPQLPQGWMRAVGELWWRTLVDTCRWHWTRVASITSPRHYTQAKRSVSHSSSSTPAPTGESPRWAAQPVRTQQWREKTYALTGNQILVF